MDYIPEAWRTPLKCDLCSGSGVAWRYPIDRSKVHPVMYRTLPEHMLICQNCHVSVAAGLISELVDRACENFEKSSPRFKALVENADEERIDHVRAAIQHKFEAFFMSFVDAYGEPLAV